MKDEIQVIIKDSKNREFKREWKNTDDKRNAIKWTLESKDLPYYINISNIVSIVVTPYNQ